MAGYSYARRVKVAASIFTGTMREPSGNRTQPFCARSSVMGGFSSSPHPSVMASDFMFIDFALLLGFVPLEIHETPLIVSQKEKGAAGKVTKNEA
jgi:hypothetical protein